MLKLSRMEARTKMIDGLRRLVFVVFCAALGFVSVAMALPHRVKLNEMEQRLEEVKKREIAVLADRDNQVTEHRAIQEDPAFLEMHARDRLNLYQDGEKILKFKKDR